MAREFGDNEPFWGETAYIMMHVVKWYVLKWCLLDFFGAGGGKAQIWGLAPDPPMATCLLWLIITFVLVLFT